MVRSLLMLGALCGAVSPAATLAADLSAPSLPVLAATPAGPPGSPGSSPWSGLYAGTQVFAMGGSHVKGLVGGGGYVGYEHEFDNRLVVGLEGSSGIARGSAGFAGLNGFNYAGTAVRVGYDMGRVMPYVFAGVDLARPTFQGNGGIGAASGINGLFSGPGKLSSFTSVGAGVAYKVTNRLTVDFAVSGTQARGPTPYGPFGAAPPP